MQKVKPKNKAGILLPAMPTDADGTRMDIERLESEAQTHEHWDYNDENKTAVSSGAQTQGTNLKRSEKSPQALNPVDSRKARGVQSESQEE